MKNKILLSITAILILTGCSKQPQIEEIHIEKGQVEQKTNIKQEEQPKTSEKKKEKTNREEFKTETAHINTTEEEVINLNESTKPKEENITQEKNVEESPIIKNEDFAKRLTEIVVYFDFDKYNIKSSEWPKVEKLSELIKANPNKYIVRIEGNCDEWGTEEYNYALGLKRANEVKKALINLGVDGDKLTIISYGELNPVCTEHNRKCWRKNRRDNFTYLP